MDSYKDEHEMTFPDRKPRECGRLQLCNDCNLTGKIRAMEDIVAALEMAHTRLREDIDKSYANEYELVPRREMEKVWTALYAYTLITH